MFSNIIRRIKIFDEHVSTFKIIRNGRHRSLFDRNRENRSKVANAPNVHLHTSSICRSFWEKDRKGGYKTETEYLTHYEHFLNGFQDLKKEITLWSEEMKERFRLDPIFLYRPGETDKIWTFDNEEILNNFVTTSDSDHNEGYSKCTFTISKAGRALFSGNLNARIPKEGLIKKGGYCAVRSKRARKSFQRDTYWDWSMYNTLVLKVRGDGRSYLINLSCEGYFDIHWNDIFHYILYTRGGPYWQTVKIPFSKFFLGSKGRVQDRQGKVPLNRISHFGFSCGEKIDGNFSLEIEYVGLEFNPEHNEEFAYEMYKSAPYVAGY